MNKSILQSLKIVNELNDQADAHAKQRLLQDRALPVAIVVAVNKAAQGASIKAINDAIETFILNIKKHKETKHNIELALIQTSDHSRVIVPLKPVQEINAIPLLGAYGENLAMAQGLEVAFNMLVTREHKLKKHQVKVKRPWLILFTDGMGNDYGAETAEKLRRYSSDKQLIVFIINIGKEDKELAKFSSIAPLVINMNQIEKIFTWFYDSFTEIILTEEGIVSLKAPEI